MDTCKFCQCVITQSYYRVGPHMACPVCVDRERLAETTERWHYYWRGMLFGVPAAIIGLLMIWGVRETSTLAGTSLFSLGAYIRGFATLFLGGLIGGAIREGSRRRSMRLTQISAAALVYLAYSMAFVPQLLMHMPAAKVNFVSVFVTILLAPFLPFLLLIKNFLAITGLICLGIAMSTAWAANKLAVEVEGPFHVSDTSLAGATPSFRTLDL